MLNIAPARLLSRYQACGQGAWHDEVRSVRQRGGAAPQFVGGGRVRQQRRLPRFHRLQCRGRGARLLRPLRLGTAVIVLPWHNPVLLAEQAATLDLLSGGRLDFGIGKGYRYNEFAGFCVDMDEADARFNECLDVIVKAWTSNEPFSHRGH
ncbi:MAG: LLM class flavin-dependent oxidoreductase, partial [Alphaproteobacteria bacterium]